MQITLPVMKTGDIKVCTGKLSDFECESRWPLSVVPGDGAEVWGKYK
jgi:hypothetical protein